MFGELIRQETDPLSREGQQAWQRWFARDSSLFAALPLMRWAFYGGGRAGAKNHAVRLHLSLHLPDDPPARGPGPPETPTAGVRQRRPAESAPPLPPHPVPITSGWQPARACTRPTASRRNSRQTVCAMVRIGSRDPALEDRVLERPSPRPSRARREAEGGDRGLLRLTCSRYSPPMPPYAFHSSARLRPPVGIRWLAGLWLLLALRLTLPVNGELVLSNFSTAKPMKIMPIGDSITDDCAYNGAWRAPLQPLLDTNGFAFTNVGRLLSGAATGFTKRRHEGYCGSVIAYPGVFGPVYNYASQSNYLVRIVQDALALTNNRPDLVLVLIGANDIGRGRNPYRVATNDMPNLLDVIFSNAPNANVLLAKPTLLLNATIGSYGAYATNVPIYNAALQAMVNQRRTLGQHLFLADMYSAVDYVTMFNSDHVHPNPLGLQAIAKEWFTRIKAISISSTQFTSVLVNGGAVWKYFDNGQDLGTNWAQPSFDDSNWNSGPARLGYGDPAVATTIGFGPEPTNKYPTAYFRHAFVVPEGVAVTNLNFRLARAGGAAVWLNGQEAFRTNLPSGPITYTNLAKSVLAAHMTSLFYPTNLAVPPLPAGTNLLAVELHQFSPSYSSFGFDLELIGAGYVIPPPTVSIARAGEHLQLSWPLLRSPGYSLYSTTNWTASNAWTVSIAAAQTNGGQVVVTQSPDAAVRFYRLQKP